MPTTEAQLERLALTVQELARTAIEQGPGTEVKLRLHWKGKEFVLQGSLVRRARAVTHDIRPVTIIKREEDPMRGYDPDAPEPAPKAPKPSASWPVPRAEPDPEASLVSAPEPPPPADVSPPPPEPLRPPTPVECHPNHQWSQDLSPNCLRCGVAWDQAANVAKAAKEAAAAADEGSQPKG